MMQKAHSVKGSAGYAGASRVSEDCYYIQFHFEERKYTKMMESYISLLEHAAQFRIHWRKRYYEFKKEKYSPLPSHAEIPLPFGWKLNQLSEEEFKCEHPQDFLDLALEAERTGKRYIKRENDRVDIEYDNFSESSLPFENSHSEEIPSEEFQSFDKEIMPVTMNPLLAASDMSDLDNFAFGHEEEKLDIPSSSFKQRPSERFTKGKIYR